LRGVSLSLPREAAAVQWFINQLASEEFRPDEIGILEDAFEDAWRRIELSAAGRTILAKYIITMAKGGERDPRWLADSAFLYLATKIEPYAARNRLTFGSSPIRHV
jgi:hypothetical protein